MWNADRGEDGEEASRDQVCWHAGKRRGAVWAELNEMRIDM
jgi:hypothetical protein